MSQDELFILGCSSQQHTRTRNQGGYLVRWLNEGMLLDPGEGMQRQLIFAGIAPTCIKRIFISHFHGDHCLGLGSILLRLNLDQVEHPIHLYYPASGQKYIDRLRYSTIYHERIQVVEHPVSQEGIVEESEVCRIEARWLDHATENLGWRIVEPARRRFDKEQVKRLGLRGEVMRELVETGVCECDGVRILIDEISKMVAGKVFAYVVDTLPCDNGPLLARGADLLLAESTYLEEHRHLAQKHHHMTAKQAAEMAKEAGAKKLVLTHFSARYNDVDAFAEEAKIIFPNSFAASDLKRFTF